MRTMFAHIDITMSRVSLHLAAFSGLYAPSGF
jgi:hypothetical protein